MFKLIRTISDNTDFVSLIKELDNDLRDRYDEEQSVYDQHNIIEDNRTVVVAYSDGVPAGCGCFKQYNDTTVEIKRMFIKQKFRGKGFSKFILKELEIWAKEMNYASAVLETGKKQNEAISLYTKEGYQQTENYGQYRDMPNSVCFKKKLL